MNANTVIVYASKHHGNTKKLLEATGIKKIQINDSGRVGGGPVCFKDCDFKMGAGPRLSKP